MLKFTQLIKEQEENTPLSSFERKIIKLIERQFGEYGVELIYYQYDIGGRIIDFLKEKIILPHDTTLELYYLYNNNLSEIREDDDAWMKNPKRGYILSNPSSEHAMALSDYLRIPPNFLESVHDFHNMKSFHDESDIGDVYGIGVEEEVQQSIVSYIDDFMWGLEGTTSMEDFYRSELNSLYGWDVVVRNMYIPEELRRTIAREDAENMMEEDEWSNDEEVLMVISRERPDMDNDWEKIEEKIYQLEDSMGSSDDSDIEMKIGELKKIRSDLAEQGRQMLYDQEYENSYDLTKDSLEWLEEYEYINLDNGSYRPTRISRDYSKDTVKTSIPKWVKVDIEGIKKDLKESINNHRGAELARFDGTERVNDYNGETYYIYKIE